LKSFNKSVFLRNSLNSDNKKYLINELSDINTVKQVSRKFKNTKQDVWFSGSLVDNLKIKNSTLEKIGFNYGIIYF
jgi:hypothetical protein